MSANVQPLRILPRQANPPAMESSSPCSLIFDSMEWESGTALFVESRPAGLNLIWCRKSENQRYREIFTLGALSSKDLKAFVELLTACADLQDGLKEVEP